MKKIRFVIIFAMFLSFLLNFTSCTCTDTPGDDYTKKIYDKLATPEITFEVLKVCVTNDLINTFYYCLAKKIRAELSLTILTSAWDEVKKQLKIDPATMRILELTPLEILPFPPSYAACIIAEYKDENGKLAREKMLFVHEQDIENYEEQNKNWRLFYPYKPYQGYDVKDLTKPKVQQETAK